MGKDLNGKELGKGIHQRKDGRYEARAKVNGVQIDLLGKNLQKLKKKFAEEKALADNRVGIMRKRLKPLENKGFSSVENVF